MTLIERLIIPLILPIRFLNAFAGIVGGVWIIFLGEWRLALEALVVSLFFPFVYSLIIMPLLSITMAGASLMERGKRRSGLAILFFGALLQDLIAILWGFLVLTLAITYASNAGENWFPYLLVAYAVAIGPFAYLASKEGPESPASYMAVFLYATVFIFSSVFILLGIGFVAIPIAGVLVFSETHLKLKLLKESS